MLVPFEPENGLEETIAAARSGGSSIEDVLRAANRCDLYISSKSEVQQDGSGFEPLLLGGRDGPLIAAFTSASRPTLHHHMAKYVLQMKGIEFFRRVPQGYGAILNPGYKCQLIISPTSIDSLRRG